MTQFDRRHSARAEHQAVTRSLDVVEGFQFLTEIAAGELREIGFGNNSRIAHACCGVHTILIQREPLDTAIRLAVEGEERIDTRDAERGIRGCGQLDLGLAGGLCQEAAVAPEELQNERGRFGQRKVAGIGVQASRVEGGRIERCRTASNRSRREGS